MTEQKKLVEIADDEAILFFHQDIVNLVQKAKEHRWDIIKWSVTLNLAIAALPTAANSAKPTIFIWLVAATTIIGLGLYVQNQVKLKAYRGRLMVNLYSNCSERFQALAQDIYSTAILDENERIAHKRRNEWRETTLFLLAIIVSGGAATIAILYSAGHDVAALITNFLLGK